MGAYTIKFATDFTKFPSVRYRRSGPNSAEEFREDFLLPALKAHQQVIVDLDGCWGMPHSFLTEAFDRLFEAYPSIEILSSHLTLVSIDDPGLIELIWTMIRESFSDWT